MTQPPRTRFSRTIVAAVSTAAALLLVSAAAPAAQAVGLRNCTDLSSSSPACYELVWVNGVEVKMTFPQSAGALHGNASADVNNFYVMAPQTDQVQGTAPFAHDHTVDAAPRQNHGPSVFWHGYFVLCSEEGIMTGRCVPTITTVSGLGTIPLADSVDGQLLTSADVIESAADAGLLTLIDTGAEYIGTISPAP